MAQLQFNAATVDPQISFDPIPAGKYVAQITGSEIKPTKDGKGSYIELQFKIVDAEDKKNINRVLFHRLNTKNESEIAQEIAFKQLSAICHATGQIQLQETTQLHGIPMVIKVSIRPQRTDKITGNVYDPSNDIKGFMPLDGGGGAAKAPLPQETNAAAAQHQKAPPEQQQQQQQQQEAPPEQQEQKPANPNYVPPATPPWKK